MTQTYKVVSSHHVAMQFTSPHMRESDSVTAQMRGEACSNFLPLCRYVTKMGDLNSLQFCDARISLARDCVRVSAVKKSPGSMA